MQIEIPAAHPDLKAPVPGAATRRGVGLNTNISAGNRAFGLDLLRTVAILLVVLGHGEAILKRAFSHSIRFWVIDGVDFFFVLSGFLIGRILIKMLEQPPVTDATVQLFWKRRWYRTLPAYYLVLVLALVYDFFTHAPLNDFNFDFVFFLQGFRDGAYVFFPVSWSLVIEEWFYFLFPLLLFGLHRLMPRCPMKSILLGVIVAVLVLPLAYRVLNTTFSPGALTRSFEVCRKSVFARMDTIMFGVLGAYLSCYAPQIWNRCRNSCLAAGLGLIVVAQLWMTDGFLQRTFYFTVLGAGILLCLPRLSSLRSPPRFIAFPITLISVVSYSMYLVHYSLILAPILKFVPLQTPVMALTMFFSYLGLTLAVSIFLYRVWEKPMMDLRDRARAK